MSTIDYAHYLQAITVSASFFICIDIFMLSVLPRSKLLHRLIKTPILIIDHCLSYSSLVNAALSGFVSIYCLYKEGVTTDAKNSHLALTILCVTLAFNLTTMITLIAYRLYDVRNHTRLFIITAMIIYSMGMRQYASLVVLVIALSQIGEIFRELAKVLEPNIKLGPLPQFLRVTFVFAFIYSQLCN